MKLLGIFVALCLLMLGVLAWQLFSSRAHLPSASVDVPPHRAPATAPTMAAALPAESPAAEDDEVAVSQPASSPVEADTNPASQTPVRWAADPALKDAWRRLVRVRAVLRDDPTHEVALRDQLAALIELHGWEEALDTLVRLAAIHPDDASLRFEQATLFLQLRRFVDAIDALKATLERDPEHARAWYDLAIAHQALGHLSDARAAWDRTIALAPSSAAAARRGEVLLDLHEWAAAAADFETVLVQEPDAPSATLNLTLALWKLGRNDEARTRLLALLQEHPRYIPALNRLAQMTWSECQSVSPNHPRCAETVDWCRQSLALDPQQADIQELLDAASQAVSASPAA